MKITTGKVILVAAILLSIFSTTISLYSSSQEKKIAYVNNSRIFTEFVGVKEGRQLFDKQKAQWQSNVDTLQFDLIRAQESYTSKASSLGIRERKSQYQALVKQQEQFMSYKAVMEQKAQEEDQRISLTIINQVNTLIKEFGEKNGYDFIFGATDDGSLLYAGEADDITDDVLVELNTKYEGGNL